jgi:hypothetical protein
MKNFSDLLAIDPRLPVTMILSPITDNGAPRVVVTINERILYDRVMYQTETLVAEVALLQPIDIRICMTDKIYCAEKETAVIIQSISIDGFEIVPGWTHLATYDNDHQRSDPTAYLGFNGCWRLPVDRPFYNWHHQITGLGWLLEPTAVTRD